MASIALPNPVGEDSCLPQIAVNEKVYFEFNYSNWLPTGVTVSSATVVATDPNGNSNAPMISGAATVLGGNTVEQLIIGAGILNEPYTLTCKAVFSDGQNQNMSGTIQLVSYVYGKPTIVTAT